MKSGVMIRDDFKGSYEEIDDYSMRIIKSQEDDSKEKITLYNSIPKGESDSKNTSSKTQPKSKKLTQGTGKISFSTKSKRAQPQVQIKEKPAKTDIETKIINLVKD